MAPRTFERVLEVRWGRARVSYRESSAQVSRECPLLLTNKHAETRRLHVYFRYGHVTHNLSQFGSSVQEDWAAQFSIHPHILGSGLSPNCATHHLQHTSVTRLRSAFHNMQSSDTRPKKVQSPKVSRHLSHLSFTTHRKPECSASTWVCRVNNYHTQDAPTYNSEHKYSRSNEQLFPMN